MEPKEQEKKNPESESDFEDEGADQSPKDSNNGANLTFRESSA